MTRNEVILGVRAREGELRTDWRRRERKGRGDAKPDSLHRQVNAVPAVNCAEGRGFFPLALWGMSGGVDTGRREDHELVSTQLNLRNFETHE